MLKKKKVTLRCITLFPGSKKQVSLITNTLKYLGREDVIVGASGVGKALEGNFYKTVPFKWDEGEPKYTASEAMLKTFETYPSCVGIFLFFYF